MKKLIFIIILFLTTGIASAQVTKATVGVDGFTCSLCAKGVEGELKSLDFVKSVKTNIKATTFDLTFKTGSNIVISSIADAINDGGFTLRDIKIIASGKIVSDNNGGFKLVTGNTPDLMIKNLNGDYKDGDELNITGMVNVSGKSVNVISAKKI
ncbi:MAG TPA: heavy-metal-associated domain-containing protein [Ignavibacteria bacterium]|nr:heavy-metal-associated domain-containing protein [Ignavibacteria bacterium]